MENVFKRLLLSVALWFWYVLGSGAAHPSGCISSDVWLRQAVQGTAPCGVSSEREAGLSWQANAPVLCKG